MHIIMLCSSLFWLILSIVHHLAWSAGKGDAYLIMSCVDAATCSILAGLYGVLLWLRRQRTMGSISRGR